MIHNQKLIERLCKGNADYIAAKTNPGDISDAIRRDTADNGQHPYAVVVCCSDSRVIPEAIFSAGIGEFFVIRVAGNVITDTQLGSIQYAAGHLGSRLILVLGHTQCGAVGAALEGGGHGYVRFLTDEILTAIGQEKDAYRATCLNAQRGAELIRTKLADDPESMTAETDVLAAVYDVASGKVEFL